ncbi:hypothetical protein ABPG72_008172 [Tetrahymena utriculariae]
MDTQNSISLHSTSIGISDYSYQNSQKDNLISGLLSNSSSNLELTVDLDKNNTFSNLNNRNSNTAQKILNKNKKIEKLDVNCQPSNIKKLLIKFLFNKKSQLKGFDQITCKKLDRISGEAKFFGRNQNNHFT